MAVMKTGNTWFVFRVMVVVAVLTAAAPALAQGDAQLAPKAVIAQTTYDFGDVFEGEELMHVFNVSNEGRSPLQLSQTPLISGTRAAPADMRVGFQSLAHAASFTTASFASARRAAPV